MAEAILPFVLQPSFRWAGNDGNWSTFQVNVGTPNQSFDVLPSTCNGETWVILPDACPPNFPECTASRGILSASNITNLGFQANDSTSWSQIGIYNLLLEQNIFSLAGTGLYGIDTLSLGTEPKWNVTRQIIAGIATPDFWLGSLGLSVQPSQFSVMDENIPTLLSTMENANLTPSAAYGLSAGASYRSSAGGIVFGGFDADAFTPNNVSFNIHINGSRSLTVSLQGLVVTNSPKGQTSMPINAPAGLNMSIDSTVSQIWLPGDICDTMADVLGLDFDGARELYLVNATARNQLLNLSPEFTFTLATNSSTANVTTSIMLPYSAFDQQIAEPYYNASTAYFPIRRAVNESQFVLGRTFLQEAYIIVDWDRGNFTLAQATHRNSGVSNNIVSILPPRDKTGIALGAAAKAGIAVGAVAGVGLGFFLLWRIWWKKRGKSRNRTGQPVEEHCIPEKDGFELTTRQNLSELPPQETAELCGEGRPELMILGRHELHEEQVKHMLMSNALHELPGHAVGYELHAQADKPTEDEYIRPDTPT